MIRNSSRQLTNFQDLVAKVKVSRIGACIRRNFTPCCVWKFPQHIPKMTLLNEAASCKALFFRPRSDPVFHGDIDFIFPQEGREQMSRLYDVLEFFGCLHVPLRITENSAALLTGDFFKAVQDCKMRKMLV